MGLLKTLPIIDIAPFLSEDPAEAPKRALAAAALHKACVDYGFFYLNLEAFVDFSQPEELATLARAFFDQPHHEKEKLALRNQDYARGYAKLNENMTNGKADAHEGLDFYKPVANPDKTKSVWGENQWPTEIPGFREKYESWIEKMKELGIVVMKAMSEGLGMSDKEWEDLKSQVDDSFWVMRVIGYPPLPDGHEGVSCGAHKDYGCLTFLYADSTPDALQVFLRPPAGRGYWINANPIPGCVVCNIGEMWEVWTNGLYRSTVHRVIHKGSNYRISIPFFFEPNFNAVVKPMQAVDRLRAKEGLAMEKDRAPVHYGQFLVTKVGNNFDKAGGGRYSVVAKL